MAPELKTMWKKAAMAKFEAVFQHWPGRSEENHGKPFMIANLRTEVWNLYLPNTK
jgi:hypothetical protein